MKLEIRNSKSETGALQFDAPPRGAPRSQSAIRYRQSAISNAPVHLTYCLNIHPGESWAENLGAIREHAAAVKRAVSPDRPFGLGLRLADAASRELAEPARLDEFRACLAGAGMYVFTVNAFPFGRFHRGPVKESVYAPDWRAPERLEFTMRVAEILASLLPEGVEGSISTVPGSYGAWIREEEDVVRMAGALVECARRLAALGDRTGRTVRLALEPEPDCHIQDTAGFLRFHERLLRGAGPHATAVRSHIGMCVDTCHMAVEGEAPAESLHRLRSAGVAVPKIQISAAVEAPNTAGGRAVLAPFAEPVYLHQTRATDAEGRVTARWPDLAPALAEAGSRSDAVRLRSHFHVPLFWPGTALLGTTAGVLDPAFWEAAWRTGGHWEIETYTFDVLPEDLRRCGVAEAVTREFRWVLERAGPGA